jgi:hypothetical protein
MHNCLGSDGRHFEQCLRQALPDYVRDDLPTIEEIERELEGTEAGPASGMRMDR